MPGIRFHTCTELVAVPMAKVEGEEQGGNGAKALPETKRKRRKEKKMIQGEDRNMESSGPSLR